MSEYKVWTYTVYCASGKDSRSLTFPEPVGYDFALRTAVARCEMNYEVYLMDTLMGSYLPD